MQGTERKQNRRETLPPEEALSQPISHPVRVRILEVVNEREMSPSEFVNSGLVPTEIAKGRDFNNQLSMVAYHFRGLLKAGCLEIVGERPVRGAVEHIYRGKAIAYFTDAQWAAIPLDQRAAISRTVYQGLVARVESAMHTETFDSQIDRTLAWTPLLLDERGWAELHTALAACFGEVEQIKVDARKRVEKSGEPGMPATFAILGFESPAVGEAASRGNDETG
jgi:hypothetical protein